MTAPRATRFPPLFVLIAGWLVPGLGHVLIGRVRRGAELLVAIGTTYGLGLLFTSGHAVSPKDHPVAFLFEALVGLPSVGIWLAQRAEPGPVVPTIPPDAIVAVIDLGILFCMTAGLLNAVAAHDAFDRALPEPPAEPHAPATEGRS